MSNALCQILTVDESIQFHEANDQDLSESVTRFSFKKVDQTRMLDNILSSLPDLSYNFGLNDRFAYVNKALTLLLDKIVKKNCINLKVQTMTEL